MKTRRVIAILFIVACSAVVGNAESILVDIVDTGVVLETGYSMPNYHGYVVNLSTESGTGLIQAVDFSGTKAFSGPMHQFSPKIDEVWYSTPVLDNSENGHRGSTADSVFNVDSHFSSPGQPGAYSVNNMIFPETGFNLQSDFGAPGSSPLDDTADEKFSVGSFLKGAFGIIGDPDPLIPVHQTSSLDVAYIVVKDGDLVTFTNAEIAVNGIKYSISGTIGVMAGDADRDGDVDGTDLAAVLNNWDPASSENKTWEQGDFDFGDDIDGTDLAAVLNGWAPTGYLSSALESPPMAAAMTAAVVPEPMTMSLLALGGLALIRRRRK